MIHWFRERHDRARTKPRPSPLFRRARRLTIERCEDRRMLSGNGSVFELSAVTPATEGGFFELNGAQVTSSHSDSFLIAAPTSSMTVDFGQTSFSGFDRGLQPDLPVLGVDSKVLGWDSSNNVFKFDHVGSLPSTDLLNSRYTIGVLNLAESAVFDQLPPTTNDAPASHLSPTLELVDVFPQSVPFDLDVSLNLDPPALDPAPETSEAIDDTPTLALEMPLENSVSGSGESPQLLVINEPILILSSHVSKTQQRSDEGGAIQVFAAVADTQQAFETKLASAVVEKLNDEDALPAIPARQTQPVFAQLARAVAFETVSYQSSTVEKASVGPYELPTEQNSTVSEGVPVPAGVSQQDSLSTSTRTEREAIYLTRFDERRAKRTCLRPNRADRPRTRDDARDHICQLARPGVGCRELPAGRKISAQPRARRRSRPPLPPGHVLASGGRELPAGRKQPRAVSPRDDPHQTPPRRQRGPRDEPRSF